MIMRRTIVAMAMVGMMIATVFVMAADNPEKEVKPTKVAEKPKELSNTQSASCILRITFDPSVLPLDEGMLDYLVKSSGILGKVTKEILQAENNPDVYLSEIGGNGSLMPRGEMGGMGGGMMGGMGMGGGMMGMGGFGGGGMSMPAPVDTFEPPTPPAVPGAPAAPSGGVDPSSGNSPDSKSADMLRNRAENQLQEAQQRAFDAERKAFDAQRRAEQLQAQMGRSSRYGGQELVDLQTAGRMGLNRDLLIRFEIMLGEGTMPAATEAMEAIIDLLRGALHRDFEAYKERMIKRADLARKQADMAENEVRQLQETLRDLSPLGELHRDQMMVEISGNQEKMRQIQLENELNRVMEDNLEQQIKEARTKAEQQIAEDPVMKDLQKLLDISRQRVDATEKMMAAGQSGQNALQDAMEKLTRANIELAQRKEVLGSYVGVQQINDLLQRLNEISVRKVQSEIQLTRLEERIRELRGNLEKAVDCEILSMRLDLAREKLSGALRRADALRDFQPEPPVVETIGAN